MTENLNFSHKFHIRFRFKNKTLWTIRLSSSESSWMIDIFRASRKSWRLWKWDILSEMEHSFWKDSPVHSFCHLTTNQTLTIKNWTSGSSIQWKIWDQNPIVSPFVLLRGLILRALSRREGERFLVFLLLCVCWSMTEFTMFCQLFLATRWLTNRHCSGTGWLQLFNIQIEKVGRHKHSYPDLKGVEEMRLSKISVHFLSVLQ
jgi:hypothetical protein